MTTNIFSQTSNYKDRLSQVRDLINSSELIMVYSQGENESSQFCYQRIYDLDLTNPGGPDSTLIKKPLQIDSTITGNKSIAVASGNFLNGTYKKFVAAWEGSNNTVRVSVPEVDSATLSWNYSNEITFNGLATSGKRKIHLVTGNFFGSDQEEFVVGFQGADATVHLQLCSFSSGSLVPQLQGSINDESTMPPGSFLNDWGIVSGDFNSDSYDEIALLFTKPIGTNNWALWITIYTIDENGNFIRKSSEEVFEQPAYAVGEIILDGTSGSFDNDTEKEIAYGFSFRQGGTSGNDTYVYLIDIKNNLDSIVVDDSKRIGGNFLTEDEIVPLNVAAGDFDKDFHDELVLATGGSAKIYSVDSYLNTEYKLSVGYGTQESSWETDAFLAVEDMDADNSSEIVSITSYRNLDPGGTQYFVLKVVSIDSTLTTSIIKARREYEEEIPTDNGVRKYAIALGDFDGDRVRLGDPVHHRRSGIMQPEVVLYTPPIHYDIIDGTVYDLSGCFPDQNCGFSSSYIQSQTTDTTITTETHEDWGADKSINESVYLFKLKVEKTYGDKFSSKESSGNSITISTGRMAAGDDWIYSNVFDIDFYEYPVYDGLDPTPIGYFIVTIPSNPRPIWMELKDDDLLGNQFRPDHETGNVLSYKSTNTFDTSRVIVDFSEQTIGATGNSFVSLQIQSFRENGIDSSWDAGLSVNKTYGGMLDIGGFEDGIEVEVNGHYNYGEIYTQTVRVQQSLEIRGDLGHLDAQYGTSGTYYVRPYSYWTSYGALALDYKVTQLPVGGNSFWQNNYGNKTDLAFSLPWRYDPEKGYPLPGNDTTYRFRSRDIILSKIDPRGGDTVTIAAKVRNFGLLAVTTPFTVKFYKGNPKSGGTMIGETTVDTIIVARGYRVVEVPWAIPISQNLDSLRIYAVIDQENAVTNEVHENNNIGWTPAVGYGSIVGVETEHNTFPEKFVLYQNYPNPFNPISTIKFELPSSGKASLIVYNILGQEVQTLVDGFLKRGSYAVQFNGAQHPSGVYFYQLQNNGFTETKKMVLLK